MRLILGGMAIALVVGSCSAASVSGQDFTSTTAAQSTAAIGNVDTGLPQMPKWAEPADYTFLLTSLCGERNLIGSFRVSVEGGVVVAAEGTDRRGRTTLRALGLGLIPTLGALLEEAEVAEQEGADVVEVQFHIDGHPSRIDIDWSVNALDDEACYAVTEFVAD